MKRTVIAIAAAWMAFAAAVHAADLEFLFVGDDGSDAVVVPSLGTNLAVNAKLVCGGTNKVAGVFAKVACSGDLGLLSIGGESAAFNGNSVSTNISLSSAAVFNLDNGFDPACAIDGETAFQLKIDVPAGTTNGTYSVGFSELQVFKNGSGDRWTTSFRPLTVVVGTPSPSTYFDPTTRTTNTCDTSLLYTGQTTLNAGWYVVDGIVTNDARIVVSGDVNLILKDNAELTASAGINVEVKNNVTNSLTIWAQSDGANMGKLTAQGNNGAAGIGGGMSKAGGTVTVTGGKVTAQGGGGGAGIGGGYDGACGTVTVNGGEVTATGDRGGAGIGGGSGRAGGTVTVTGGKVTAQGGNGGAGIGGGYESYAGVMLTIKPSAGTAIAVAAGADAGSATPIDGSPFTAQKDVTGSLGGKSFVYVGKAFEAGDIALTAYEGVYDGEGHTIGIATNAIPGLVLRYSSPSSPMSPSSPSDTLPLFTNVCDMVVYVEASAPGYVTFTTNATVKITTAPLTVTAKDQTYRYNGTTQGEGDTVYEDPAVIAGKVEVDGLKGADTLASIILDGQGTDAGTYPIEPSQASVANGGDTVTGNYDINYVNGTLTILGEAAVSNVQAASGDPWDGKVQIAFNVTNSPAACLPDWNKPYLSIVATDNVTGSNYVSVASALSGDTDTADGAHAVEWDFKAQGIDFVSTNVTFTVAYLRMPDWCVIDLSGGKDAAHYPVTYVSNVPDVPGGTFNTDAYKTTNLVMRLIGPEADGERPFYCAVFETTQRQWELVMGNRPSYFTNEAYYATRPVEQVSWNMIRGDANTYDWPATNAVDESSFLGLLRARTGLSALDLPTEAQWEYACRAGTRTDFNNDKNMTGDNCDTNLNEVARYWWNGGSPDPNSNEFPAQNCEANLGTAAVGSYKPNAWGLYDFHGNVWEWCLDRYSSSVSTRVARGGGWNYYSFYCTSSYRYYYYPSYEYYYIGFRLVRTLSNNFESERSAEAAAGAERAGTVCAGTSEPITVGKKPAAELAAELKWKHLKATGTYFAQLKLTCTNWLDSGISDLRFMFADRVGADGKTSAALWSTPLRSANTNVEESDGTTYRFVALDESLFEEENTPVVYGVADLSAAAIPVAERTIEMYVRTGVAPEGQNADSAQVDDFVGYVCWTSSDEACAVPVVASGVKAGPKFGAVRPLAGASLPSPKTLNESLALGVPVVEGSSPYCRVTEFSADGERIKGRIEVGAGENVGSLGANATVTVLGAASPAGPFEELGAVEVAEDGSFSLAVAEGAQFFKLRIDIKEVVR